MIVIVNGYSSSNSLNHDFCFTQPPRRKLWDVTFYLLYLHISQLQGSERAKGKRDQRASQPQPQPQLPTFSGSARWFTRLLWHSLLQFLICLNIIMAENYLICKYWVVQFFSKITSAPNHFVRFLSNPRKQATNPKQSPTPHNK